MRPAAVLLLLFSAACAPQAAAPQRTLQGGAAPERSRASGVVRSLPPNLKIEVYEVVERPEADGLSYTVISVDGTSVGRTEAGLKSARKIWQGRVQPGNRLLRFERWILPRVSEWSKVRESRQPRERFVRVEAGMRSIVTIKYRMEGRKYVYRIIRERTSER